MYEDELRIAELAVQRACILTERVLTSIDDDDSMEKADQTPVTVGDLGAQALIISALHHHFPQDTFTGEESASALRENPKLAERVWQLVSSTHLEDAESESLLASPKSLEEMLDLLDLGLGPGGREGRVWVLDPIDGTLTFMKGGQYAVCLCLVENGEQRVGVLGCPKLSLEAGKISETTIPRDGGYGYLVSAVRGQGVFLRRLSSAGLQQRERVEAPVVADENDLQIIECIATTSMDVEKHRLVAEKLGVSWPGTELWSTQMKYIALAIGGHDFWLRIPKHDWHRTCVWDHAGGQLIYEELGGKVTDIYGKDIDFGAGRRCHNNFGNVAAPAAIHGRVLEAVKEVLGGVHPPA
jgi:3'(2'), 5'-bisphosphate nucleotidase